MKKYDLAELQAFSHDELNEMLEAHEISLSEWVEAQPETYDGYSDWLAENGLQRGDQSARLFIHHVEDDIESGMKSPAVQSCSETVEEYKRVKSCVENDD